MDRPIDLNRIYTKGVLTREEWTDPALRGELYHLEYLGQKLRGGFALKQRPDLLPWANLSQDIRDIWIQKGREAIEREGGNPLPEEPTKALVM